MRNGNKKEVKTSSQKPCTSNKNPQLSHQMVRFVHVGLTSDSAMLPFISPISSQRGTGDIQDWFNRCNRPQTVETYSTCTLQYYWHVESVTYTHSLGLP